MTAELDAKSCPVRGRRKSPRWAIAIAAGLLVGVALVVLSLLVVVVVACWRVI